MLLGDTSASSSATTSPSSRRSAAASGSTSPGAVRGRHPRGAPYYGFASGAASALSRGRAERARRVAGTGRVFPLLEASSPPDAPSSSAPTSSRDRGLVEDATAPPSGLRALHEACGRPRKRRSGPLGLFAFREGWPLALRPPPRRPAGPGADPAGRVLALQGRARRPGRRKPSRSSSTSPLRGGFPQLTEARSIGQGPPS